MNEVDQLKSSLLDLTKVTEAQSSGAVIYLVVVNLAEVNKVDGIT